MTEIKDTYQVLHAESYGEYKEKGSKFLAYAYPVTSIEDVELYMEQVRSLHPKARHHCYAYRIGLDGDVYRANDDGEPSGTAGKPIYGQLLSQDVSDVLVIVVRYFGGTKLGASGLIHAYKTATFEALNIATKKNRVLSDVFVLSFDYGEMGHVMNVIKTIDLPIIEKVFENQPMVKIELPKSTTDKVLIRLKAMLLNISTEQVDEKTEVPFCKITPEK